MYDTAPRTSLDDLSEVLVALRDGDNEFRQRFVAMMREHPEMEVFADAVEQWAKKWEADHA